MSGGRFEYNQYRVLQLADEVQIAAANLAANDETPAEIVARVVITAKLLRAAGECAHALDYWLSCDTSESDFVRDFDAAVARIGSGPTMHEAALAALETVRVRS